MNLLSVARSYRRLQHQQWLTRETIRKLQQNKLDKLLRHAYQHVTYYRDLFDCIGLKPQDIRSLDDLVKIPVTTKADLQKIPALEKISDQYRLDELITEHSSGSSGQPFTAYFDKQFLTTRNNMFLRALRVMGYRPGQKLMLITAGHNRKRPWLRWHYASIESSAEKLIDQFNHVRPSVLYGCTTPLRLMALHAIKSNLKLHHPNTVISTAETLDQATRALLEKTFEAKVYDLYGLTEMGLVAWQCPAQNGYHLSEDTTIIEFDYDENYQSNKLIMTNLELTAMPLIRYQTGDLARAITETDCSCGRQLQRIERIEGRMMDCIRLIDGSVISPYRITLTLEKIPGLGRYQLIQDDIDQYTIRVENSADQTAPKYTIETGISAAIHAALTPVLGLDTQLSIRFEHSINPPPGKKFRVIESRISSQAS